MAEVINPNSRPLPHQDAMDCDSPAASVSQDSLMAEEYGSGFKYSIACSMPSDRSRGDWKVHFAACYSTSTGISLLWQLAEELYGKDAYFYVVNDIGIRGGYFEICPETWSDNIWKIDASEKQAFISEGQILRVSEYCVSSKAETCGQSYPYPPRLCYDVSHLNENDHSKLNCSMYAHGAVTVNGCTPYFHITSTPPPTVGRTNTKKGERVLFTVPYLYGADSDIIRVLTEPDQDITLDTLKSEHRKFLADISLQLSDTHQLCEVLERYNDEHLDTFTILGNWVASQDRAASLMQLKRKLRTMGIVDIAVFENEDSSDLLSPHLENHSIMNAFNESLSVASSNARLALPEKLQCCWKEVGRLLGISPNELDIIAEENELNLFEQSYQLIYRWQRRVGNGATFGALFKAIHRVFHYQLMLVNDAYQFCQYFVRNHLPIP